MPIVESELALLRHPRLAALATSAWPAWLWSADGSRMLWANAVGAAIFGAQTRAPLRNAASTPRRLRRPDRSPCRDAAVGGAGAARTAARLRRRLRPRADLRLLAHRCRRQGARPYRGSRAGGPGADAWRAGAPSVCRGATALLRLSPPTARSSTPTRRRRRCLPARRRCRHLASTISPIAHSSGIANGTAASGSSCVQRRCDAARQRSRACAAALVCTARR